VTRGKLEAEEGKHLLEAVLRACRRAGEIVGEHFRSSDLEVEHKADETPVTVADRGAEAAIRETLREAAPEFGFLGEEFGTEGSESDRWVIDPIDGTKNFVAGLPYFATLVALEIGGEIELGVVHAPALGETWWALRGEGAYAMTGTELGESKRLEVSTTSDLGQAFLCHGGLKHFIEGGLWPAFTEVVKGAGRTRGFGDWWGHVLVAEGRSDAMLDPIVAYHDVAAISLLVEEAGGVFTALSDDPLGAGYTGPAMSSNSHLTVPLREKLSL